MGTLNQNYNNINKMEINTSVSDRPTNSNSPPLSPAVRSQLDQSSREYGNFNDPLKLNEEY